MHVRTQSSLMLANSQVALPKMAPIHTFFIRFSFRHFNWHNTLSISRAVRLKNDENSPTHRSLSAIMDSLILGTWTSLPYMGGIVMSDGKKAKYIYCELLFRNVLRNSVSLYGTPRNFINMGCCRGRNILLFILVLQMVSILSHKFGIRSACFAIWGY